MRYLNLSNGDFLLDPSVDCEIIRFPSGFETTIRARNCTCPVTIVARIESSTDILLIAQAVDVLRNGGCPWIGLFLPFVPNARQDRRMVETDAFGLKVFADYINSLRLDRVTVFDAHSNVTTALINNCINISPSLFQVPILVKDERDFTLVSPDLGAMKKVEETAKKLFEFAPSRGFPKILPCFKKRNPKNGEITGVDACGQVGLVNYILDDILDGGYTFIQLAKLLKQMGASEVNLIISHGIFSKGLAPIVNAGIKKIYTSNSFNHRQNIINPGGEIVEIADSLHIHDIRPLLKSYL